MPVDNTSRTTRMVANAQPQTKTCKDDTEMTDISSYSSEHEDCGTQNQHPAMENENTLKNLTELDFRTNYQHVVGSKTNQLDFRKSLATPETQSDSELNEILEPREQRILNGHPLPATPLQQSNVTPNSIAVAGARAANLRAHEMPFDVEQAFKKVQSYYASKGTTLYEALHAQATGQSPHQLQSKNQAYQQLQTQQQLLQQRPQQQIQQQQLQQQQQQQKHHWQQQQNQQRGQGHPSSVWNLFGGSSASCSNDDHHKLKKQLEAANKEYISLKDEFSLVKEGKRKYRKELRELKKERDLLLLERQEQGESIRQAQDAVFDIMKKSASHAETDDKIRSAIESDLFEPITNWSKQFSLSKELDPAVYSDALFQELFSQISCKDITPNWLMEDRSLRPKQIPRLLAKAFLSFVVTTNIIDSPFFLLNMNPEDGSRGDDIERLNSYRHRFTAVDPKEGNKWRSHTVAAISQLVAAYEERKDSHLLNLSEVFATEFENSGARYVLEERSEASHRALVDVFRKAGELALRLWRYPTDMNSIGAYLLTNRTFQLGSVDMKAHTSHRLVDEYDTSMDGSEVAFVVFPGIRANGNQEGEMYEEYKVWLKAEVRLSKAVTDRSYDAKSEDQKPAKHTPPPPPALRRSEKANNPICRQ